MYTLTETTPIVIEDKTGYYAALFNSRHNRTILELSYGLSPDYSRSRGYLSKFMNDSILVTQQVNLIHKGTVTSKSV